MFRIREGKETIIPCLKNPRVRLLRDDLLALGSGFLFFILEKRKEKVQNTTLSQRWTEA